MQHNIVVAIRGRQKMDTIIDRSLRRESDVLLSATYNSPPPQKKKEKTDAVYTGNRLGFLGFLIRGPRRLPYKPSFCGTVKTRKVGDGASDGRAKRGARDDICKQSGRGGGAFDEATAASGGCRQERR